MLRRPSLPNYFASKTQSIFRRCFFLAAGNKKFQRANAKRVWCKWISTWRMVEDGMSTGSRTRLVDSLICITCSLENNELSVLHYVRNVGLYYQVLHRFEIFSAPGTIALGSIRLPLRRLASSRGCPFAIIINKRYSRLIIRCPEQM